MLVTSYVQLYAARTDMSDGEFVDFFLPSYLVRKFEKYLGVNMGSL